MSRSPMLIPKPRGRRRARFIPSLPEGELARSLGRLAPAERKALARVVETADLITVADRSWLLVPAPGDLLDALAEFGAALDDLENDLCDEPEIGDSSDGFDDDREPDGEDCENEAGRRTYVDRLRRQRTMAADHVVKNSDGRVVNVIESRWCTGDRGAEAVKVRRFLARLRGTTTPAPTVAGVPLIGYLTGDGVLYGPDGQPAGRAQS